MRHVKLSMGAQLRFDSGERIQQDDHRIAQTPGTEVSSYG